MHIRLTKQGRTARKLVLVSMASGVAVLVIVNTLLALGRSISQVRYFEPKSAAPPASLPIETQSEPEPWQGRIIYLPGTTHSAYSDRLARIEAEHQRRDRELREKK